VKTSSLKLLGGCAVVAMLALMATQRVAISRTRAANEVLREQSEAAAPVVAAQLPDVSRDEIEALQEANQELAKLRNEVRTLREERRELEKFQAENQRLAAALKGAPKASAPPPLSEAEGFVLKQTWSKAGFATPEATVQSFFWAIANKDIAALAECVTGDARKSMEEELQRSAAGGKGFEENFGPFAQMQGFRIAEKNKLSENKVEVSVQAAAGGRAIPMRLQLENGEWKLSN